MATLQDTIRAHCEAKYPERDGFEVAIDGIGQEVNPVEVVVKDKHGQVVAHAKSTMSLSEFLAKL